MKAEKNNQPRTRVNCFQIICGIKEAGEIRVRARLFLCVLLFSQPDCKIGQLQRVSQKV